MNARNKSFKFLCLLSVVFLLCSCEKHETNSKIVYGDYAFYYLVACDHKKAVEEGVLEPILDESGKYKYVDIGMARYGTVTILDENTKANISNRPQYCIEHESEHFDDLFYYKYENDDRYYLYRNNFYAGYHVFFYY